MSAGVRFSFPKGRLVFPVWQGESWQRWCALHRDRPDWSAIFADVLKLIAIDTTRFPDRLQLGDGAGEVAWHRRWCGTTIQVQLLRFSKPKRNLVAAALLKAARYAQPKECYAKSQ
jgi:hypothetical protein